MSDSSQASMIGLTLSFFTFMLDTPTIQVLFQQTTPAIIYKCIVEKEQAQTMKVVSELSLLNIQDAPVDMWFTIFLLLSASYTGVIFLKEHLVK